MKCTRDGLKHLSGVLEKIQLFELQKYIVAQELLCWSTDNAEMQMLILFLCLLHCFPYMFGKHESRSLCRISSTSVFSYDSLFQLPAQLETLFLSLI